MTQPKDSTGAHALDWNDLSAVEKELLQGPSARLHSSPPGNGDRELAKSIVARFRRRSLVRNVSFGALGGLAAAASVALALRQSSEPLAAKVTGASQTSAPSYAVLEGGEIFSGVSRLPQGHLLTVGQRLTTQAAPACVRAEPGIRVCLGASSEIELVAAGAHHSLRVLRGAVVADLVPLPEGRSFSLSSQHGEASVLGTLFAVEVLSDSQTVVRVSRGRVSVRNGLSREVRTVEAGQVVWLGEQFSAGLLGATELARDQLLLGGGGKASQSAQATDLTEADAVPSTGVAVQPRPGTRPEPEADAIGLLDGARKLRGERRYAEAAGTYRQLLQRHPRSPEARAGLVSLGQLQLSHLGDAGGALGSFERYLAGPGQLRQEALFGKIQALEKLGRSVAEQREIDTFLKAYPNSAQATALKHRLSQLR